MGAKNMMVVLLWAFFCSICAASSGRLGLTTLPLVELQDHQQNKLGHGIGGRGGANGGHMPGTGEASNGGSGSNSPYVQGGAAVVPLYAAGSGAKVHQNNHHNAGNCVQSCTGSTALVAILLAYLLRDMHLFV